MTHARLYLAADFMTVPELVGVQAQGVDIEHFIRDQFTITDARTLQARAILNPIARPQREFVVQFSSITVEAQNALLKLFEEPPVSVVFHVVTQRADTLLPTVRSRLQQMTTTATDTKKTAILKTFAERTLGEQFTEIAARTKAKDTTWIELFLSELEVQADAEARKGDTGLLQAVVYVRQYTGMRGASMKMLLEELTLTMEKVRL